MVIRVRRSFRKIRRGFGSVVRFLRGLGWRLLLVVLGVVISLEVITGIFQGAYVRGPYQFLLIPLPVLAGIVLAIDVALSKLRKRLYAGFLLSFVIGIVETALTGVAIYITLTRFSIPQVTTYIVFVFAVYQVWLAWRRGVWGKKLRRPKKAHASHH